jgi:hypothetical protein
MLIIGLCGVSGSGKDTIADLFVRYHGFAKIAIADPLKRFCRDIYLFTTEQLWGTRKNEPDERYPRPLHMLVANGQCKCMCCGTTDLAKPCFLTPRFALQQLGTEWGRFCYQNIWIHAAIKTATLLQLDPPGYRYNQYEGLIVDNDAKPVRGVVIPDVRFENEVDSIIAAGGKVIQVLRPSISSSLDDAYRQHRSETEQAQIDPSKFYKSWVNDGTIEKLRELVDEVVAKLSPPQ